MPTKRSNRLNAGERAVLELLGRRLGDGRRVYGPLYPVVDRREWKREALEEIADALVYVACELVRLGARSRRSRASRSRRSSR